MKNQKNIQWATLMLFFAALMPIGCSSSSTQAETPTTPPENPNPPAATNDVDFWLTKGDRSAELEKQDVVLGFGNNPNNFTNIEVDDSQTFQTIDGFGFTLTGGSVAVIDGLSPAKKQELLQELFGKDDNSISISYLRISVGASDLNEEPFSYDDLAEGEIDPELSEFSLAKDEDVISLLKEILTINPELKILASPWSPPTWMKDNKNFKGGSLLPEYYEVYAQYLVKYIQSMSAEGISIDALTPQNEPLNPDNNPSLYMSALQQADFIKNNLGPAFKDAILGTKIIAYDHNCDKPEYPITVLNDAGAYPYVDGSAFHLYAGDIAAMGTVHEAFPEKNVYFTEQYVSSNDDFAGALKWHLKNVIIGSMRNWSKNALEWNLANNSSFGPHTDGGCTVCKGALTISSDGSIQRNVSYYVVGQIAKFVPAGATRISSNISGNLQNVAFVRPDGKKVLVVENDGNSGVSFNIKYKGKWVMSALEAGAVGTYIWE